MGTPHDWHANTATAEEGQSELNQLVGRRHGRSDPASPVVTPRRLGRGTRLAQDYPLEELSPRAFEQLVVALGLRVLGPGVEAFGSGPDGGREATFRGRVDWALTHLDDEGAWNGYVVLQAKQVEHASPDPAANLRSLREQVDSELDSWMSEFRCEMLQ